MEKSKKTILITGASSGIGREIAIKLAKEGHSVFAGIRRKIDKNEIENLNLNIKGVYIDVTNASSIDKAFWFVLKNTNKLDVLINNAGIVEAFPIELIDIKRLKEQFDVNTFGAILTTQRFIQLLENGRIINMSSMASTGIFPYIAPYCASKRAMDILMNSFALENKNHIKVISIKPSAIKTPIWEKSVKKAEEVFELLKDTDKNKYKKEFEYMKKHALNSGKKGLEIYKVTDKIVEIINAKNPKPSYTIGFDAFIAEIFSKLPLCVINKLIQLKLNSNNQYK